MTATEVVKALRGRAVPLAVGLIGGLLYLKWAPSSPDLAAQVARANVVRAEGVSSWWTGWFGGVLLPSYSVAAPAAMAVLSVRATGVIAVAVTLLACRALTRDSARPRAALLACALSSAADLLNGRTTFVVGAAAGLCALAALRSDRRRSLVVALAAATYAASPLAGLFLGIVLVASAATDRSRRVTATASAAVVLILAAGSALFFPGAGTMPFDVAGALPAALCCATVAVVCAQPVVRLTALLTLASITFFLIVPLAVGANITRLAWVSAAPVTVACARLGKGALVVVVTALAVWPAHDLVGQLGSAQSQSSRAAFYQPLIAELDREQSSSDPAEIGARVEVLDPANHWASVYLADYTLARGWDRQADVADNPIFYRDGALTAASYRQWLLRLAVGWVAVPRTRLDYASIKENALVVGGLEYLREAWSSRDWVLYRVADPAPFATGATVTAIHGASVSFATRSEATVQMSVRWSPYLAVLSSDPATPVASCVENDGGFVRISVTEAGSYQLVSHFEPLLRLARPNSDCEQDLFARRPG